LSICEKNKIKLILIRYPIAKLYLHYAKMYVDVNRFYNTINNFTLNYNNIILLDYHDAFFSMEHLFCNQDHLNIKGSTVLTRMLKDDLKTRLVLPGKRDN